MPGTRTILVVEDQHILCELYIRVLQAAGYRALGASDGVEALAVIERQPVDLVVSDIEMPRMNGYQLYERLRERPEWVYIPFLFLSARGLDSDIRYGKQLGADDYLTKPIMGEDLLASVAGKLRRSRQLSQMLSLSSPAQQKPARSRPDLAFGPIQIDIAQHQAWRNSEPVQLSPHEFTLLALLVERAGGVVSLSEIVRATHGYTATNAEAGLLIRPLVRSLRRRLGYDTGEMGCIENVRGLGYRLKDSAAKM